MITLVAMWIIAKYKIETTGLIFLLTAFLDFLFIAFTSATVIEINK